jgi:hypothetical protein
MRDDPHLNQRGHDVVAELLQDWVATDPLPMKLK